MYLHRNILIRHLNAHSIFAFKRNCKLEQLSLVAACYNFDGICVSESWLDSTIDNDCISLHGCLRPFRLDRNSHGGGVMAYVKSDILCTRKLDLEVAGIEIMWLDISLCNSKTLLLGVCYQPPNYNVTQKQNFIDCLSILINASLHNASKIVLLAGDFDDRSVDKPLPLQSELFRFLLTN